MWRWDGNKILSLPILLVFLLSWSSKASGSHIEWSFTWMTLQATLWSIPWPDLSSLPRNGLGPHAIGCFKHQQKTCLFRSAFLGKQVSRAGWWPFRLTFNCQENYMDVSMNSPGVDLSPLGLFTFIFKWTLCWKWLYSCCFIALFYGSCCVVIVFIFSLLLK